MKISAIRDVLRLVCPWCPLQQDFNMIKNIYKCLPNKINRIINHLLWSISEFDLYTCSCASEILDLIHFVFICGTLLTPPVHNNYTQTPFLSGQNPMLNTRCYTQPYAYVQPCITWYCYGFFFLLFVLVFM